MEKKILVALDGSSYSKNTIRYLCRFLSDVPEMHIHLLSLIPGSSGAVPSQWQEQADFMKSISPANVQKKKRCKQVHEQAMQALHREGYTKEQVSSSFRFSSANIAMEIITEARKDLYDAIVVGRRGLGKIEEWIMGSVSGTVLEKCTEIPVWIIDGEVRSDTFLVPVDGGPHCLKAIDHLSFILKDHPSAEITLFNSKSFFTRNIEVDPTACYTYMSKEWCDTHYAHPDRLFNGPMQILREAGFPEERIHIFQTNKGLYPSRQIVREALIHDFGTIVMGRRGELYKKGVFQGVSDRVLAMAEGVAIWII